MHLMVKDTLPKVAVFTEIRSGEGIDELNPYTEEVNDWISVNGVEKLPYPETWKSTQTHPSRTDYPDGEAEYFLTEKQSALFLLRFK